MTHKGWRVVKPQHSQKPTTHKKKIKLNPTNNKLQLKPDQAPIKKKILTYPSSIKKNKFENAHIMERNCEFKENKGFFGFFFFFSMTFEYTSQASCTLAG